jgi:hypothetical protein
LFWDHYLFAAPYNNKPAGKAAMSSEFSRKAYLHWNGWGNANPHKNPNVERQLLWPAMTLRDYSTRSSALAPMHPRRKRCAAAAGLLLLQALVGRTDACSVGVSNNYNVSLSLYSYNGFDNLCTDPYQTASVEPGYDSKCTLVAFPNPLTGCIHLSLTHVFTIWVFVLSLRVLQPPSRA